MKYVSGCCPQHAKQRWLYPACTGRPGTKPCDKRSKCNDKNPIGQACAPLSGGKLRAGGKKRHGTGGKLPPVPCYVCMWSFHQKLTLLPENSTLPLKKSTLLLKKSTPLPDKSTPLPDKRERATHRGTESLPPAEEWFKGAWAATNRKTLPNAARCLSPCGRGRKRR